MTFRQFGRLTGFAGCALISLCSTTVFGQSGPKLTFTVGSTNTQPFITKDPKVQLTVTMTPAPTVDSRLDFGPPLAPQGIEVSKDAATTIPPIELDLSAIKDRGEVPILVTLTDRADKTKVLAQGTVTFNYDATPPKLTGVRLEGTPGSAGTLILEFESDDFDAATTKLVPFEIKRLDDKGDFTISANTTGAPQILGNTIKLVFGPMATGTHRLKIPKATAASGIKDLAGNIFNNEVDFFWTFEAYAERSRGKHVEYPPVLPRNRDEDPDCFDPGDIVETKVFRLYYFRDAHRVVELINRDVRQYNRAGFDQARRLATEARELAEQATDERRRKEFAAAQNAYFLRQKEREIKQVQLDIANEEHLQNLQMEEKATKGTTTSGTKTTTVNKDKHIDNARDEATKSSNETRAESVKEVTTGENPPVTTREKEDGKTVNEEKDLNATRFNERGNETTTTTTTTSDTETTTNQGRQQSTKLPELRSQLGRLNNELAALQSQAIAENNDILKLTQTEDRKVENQFRLEVAAGMADPDTYVPGKKESVDPVSQVSLSVIGEGVIQARGPIRGVNKIARMIHQIDTPVGQVKVGIHTVQINGEHGNRMELVYERIDKHLAQSRFLTTQSLEMFRKAVVMVADRVASQVDAGLIPPGCNPNFGVVAGGVLTPVGRDYRYSLLFFGADFVNELGKMESELLNAENKLLSLHSMDTISLAGAIAIAALADHPIRQDILNTFMVLVQNDLPRIEAEYYRALTRIRHSDRLVNAILVSHFNDKLDFKDMVRIEENARRTYHFPSLINHLNTQLSGPGTLNSVQFATLRLAQALKAQLAAELEFRNLRTQRSLVERCEGEIEGNARQKLLNAQNAETRSENDVDNLVRTLFDELDAPINQALDEVLKDDPRVKEQILQAIRQLRSSEHHQALAEQIARMIDNVQVKLGSLSASQDDKARQVKAKSGVVGQRVYQDFFTKRPDGSAATFDVSKLNAALSNASTGDTASPEDQKILTDTVAKYDSMVRSMATETLVGVVVDYLISVNGNLLPPEKLRSLIDAINAKVEPKIEELAAMIATSVRTLLAARQNLELARREAKSAEEKVFATRLLDQLIDEQEEKAVELLEAMRAHVSNIDNYLKRIATAIEDDVNAQFYNPAFLDIRRASRFWDVTLGQIETTTILTNNRAFAKVLPTATMEFDLPKREIFITEGMQGAKALVQDYGNLMNDPTFLTASAMLAGQPAAGMVGSRAPVQRLLGTEPTTNPKLGSSLEALIPDPAIYKFETGTGFEIRPVIQPDGQSIVYSFDYMYTTNIREPVNPDEKHLGRVKRHFVHTDVQTSSYELREVSRYTVALKASRTGQGVPLLQDVPLVGALFRPLPSDESSLQENIILASSVVYPTVFDLYGLRWSPYADAIASTKLVHDKKNERYRYEEMRNQILSLTRKQVDARLGIPSHARLEEEPRALVAPPGALVVPRPQRPPATLYEDMPRPGLQAQPGLAPQPGIPYPPGLREDVPPEVPHSPPPESAYRSRLETPINSGPAPGSPLHVPPRAVDQAVPTSELQDSVPQEGEFELRPAPNERSSVDGPILPLVADNAVTRPIHLVAPRGAVRSLPEPTREPSDTLNALPPLTHRPAPEPVYAGVAASSAPVPEATTLAPAAPSAAPSAAPPSQGVPTKYAPVWKTLPGSERVPISSDTRAGKMQEEGAEQPARPAKTRSVTQRVRGWLGRDAGGGQVAPSARRLGN